ncbi:thymidylate kinase [Vararia minispora EC-137]|uniref:Thymidylate kinase n=1 Tax=Vararia minispora EC-137 TaxID=1314806 RepID=A0ACB8QHY3_9AGAM|nr:thymidylate kinase [Vararia minispora EC-137]
MTEKRGAFIVIEGLDRSGKSTQAAALVERLSSRNIPAKLFKFPDRATPIGKMIDAYLRSESELDDRAVHLLFSANRWELAVSIERILASGTTIICDRYAFSGIAFSAAKGLPYDWCAAPDAGLPMPDVTLFFDVTPEIACARCGYGEERYEREELQARVREQFLHIGAKMGETWKVVDAGKERDVVSEDVWAAVAPLVTPSKLETVIGRLWQE